MSTPLVVTFVGPDRPGLVNTISDKIAAHGGAWLESRLAHLAGEFAGIVLVSAPEAGAEALTAALRDLESADLRVTVAPGLADAAPPREILRLDLVGLDRPGIVRDVTQTLTGLGVNIEEFESGIESAPFSGEPMFRVAARLGAPEGLARADLSKALERLAGELMVDISVHDAKAPAK